MIISRMHYEIKFRWNKMNSNHKIDFPKEELDDAINKASDDYVEIFYSGNNSKEYKLGFEVTQQRVDMLSSLVIPDQAISPTVVTANKLYKVDLSVLDPKYKHFIRGSVISPGCSKAIPITIVRHNDLDYKLRDENQKPNLKWNRCLGLFKTDGLYLYSDYVISNVFIEYVSVPVKVFSGGYDSLEYLAGDTSAYNIASPIVDSNIPEHDLLVDMTVQYLSRTLEDTNKFTLLKEQILSKT